ncbi:MAG TPA: hypothetical protein VGG28_29990, partial [Kofleriaceae bacterium]
MCSKLCSTWCDAFVGVLVGQKFVHQLEPIHRLARFFRGDRDLVDKVGATLRAASFFVICAAGRTGADELRRNMPHLDASRELTSKRQDRSAERL